MNRGKSEGDIKIQFSYLLKEIQDATIQETLRQILFDPSNNINWESAWNILLFNRPEMKRGE